MQLFEPVVIAADHDPFMTNIKKVVYDDPLVNIMKRIVDGSQLDLAKLFDSTSKVIFALVMRIVGDRKVAEDVLFDIYVQVWNQSAHYDPGGETPAIWLGKLARKQVLEYVRLNGQLQFSTPATIASGFNFAALNPEEIWRQSVSEALDLLPTEQRQALEMAYYGGFDCDRIAKEMRLSPGIIQGRIAIAMRCLSRKLIKSHNYQFAGI